jgi:UDP-N-acetylmuramoylalanine--D-glutamate ligase
MRLPGLHNRRNAVAAFALARCFKATTAQAEAVLAEFAGLPFRLEDEGMFAGIRFVNDSISTAPEAAAAALAALGPAVATLIAGGHDRGYRFEPLIEAAAASAVETFILLPDTGGRIAALLRERLPQRRVIEVPELPAAVQAAFRATPPGRTCLFSPGAPSYNAYGSFAERGRHFRALLAAARPAG